MGLITGGQRGQTQLGWGVGEEVRVTSLRDKRRGVFHYRGEAAYPPHWIRALPM